MADQLPGGFGYMARLSLTDEPQSFPFGFPFSCGYSAAPLEIEIGGAFVRDTSAAAVVPLTRAAFDAQPQLRGFAGSISVSWKVRGDVQGDEIELRLSGGGARITIPGDASYQVKAHLPAGAVRLPVTFEDDTQELEADAARPVYAQGLVVCGYRAVPTYSRNEHRFTVGITMDGGRRNTLAATIPRHAHAVECFGTLNNSGGPPYPIPLPDPSLVVSWLLEDGTEIPITDPWRGAVLVPTSAIGLLVDSASESAESVCATFYLKS